MNHKTLEITATCLLCAIFVVFFCTEIILNFTPPISRDALVHHLAIPKLWLKHGGYYEIPWADYSYYPMYINLIYLICLYLKNDIAPKFIHLAFGVGTSILVYIYLKQRLGRNWGFLGLVIFFTTPIVVWLSTSAYIDLGMTFFTTASVMAFITWRDSKYNELKWLLISSFCMGIAVGSKYNALIAMFIMNIFLMLSLVRDTHKQMPALKYGIMFFVIAVIVASPWYLKNYIQTGNPLYPLFNSFFQSLHHQQVQEILHHQVIKKTQEIGFFQMREVMYGESFWGTLLIPIRMFFQGKDNSYQYFQGVLNPILILFLPFSIIDKKYRRNTLLFLFFSIFFIFMAYFLTEKQVRYILPTLPFLAILAVMGIKNLTDTLEEKTLFSSPRSHEYFRSIAIIVLFAAVSILLVFNFSYLRNRINIIKPLPYVFGKETRDAFLKRHLLHYEAVEYINANLPEDVKVFTLFLGRRGYYLHRNYKNESSFGMNTIRHMISNSTSEKKFYEYINSLDITHILMRTELVDNYLKNNFSQEEIKRFINLTRKSWKMIYDYCGYAVWEIRIDGDRKIY